MNYAEKTPRGFFGSLTEPGALTLLSRVSGFLDEQGVQAYIVGGFIRDRILKRKTADIDIAVAGDSLKIAAALADAFGGRYVLLDDKNGIGRVVLPDWEIDFCPLKGGDIKDDLSRRDFTVDAMAVDLSLLDREDVPVIDPFGGQEDLRRGIIRAVSRNVFQSDAVRLLRGVRLAYELGFSIDPDTESLIRKESGLVKDVAGERVRDELLRLLAIPGADRLLNHLDELGLLTTLIPELTPEKGVEQPREHYWNVFEHSLRMVLAVDFLLRQGDWEYDSGTVLALAPWSTELNEYFNRTVSRGSTRRVMIKMAALLHDIAKPQTKAVQPNGKTRFLGHAPQGAEIAAGVLERLRFSSKEIKLVETLVTHHLRPTQMSQEGLPSRRAIYRYFRDTGEVGVDILFSSMADHLATRGPNLDIDHWREHTRLVDYVLTERSSEESLVKPPKLLSGDDLITIFGLSPGPALGDLLEAVREAQASGELNTKEEALAYVSRHLSGGE